MNPRVSRAVAVGQSVWAEMRRSEATFLAASIAYYAFVSLVPLLVLSIVVASAVGGDELAAAVRGLTGQYLLPVGQDVVTGALQSTGGRSSVTLVGVAVLAWGSLKLFRALDVAFARVYATKPGSLTRQIKDGLIALVGVGTGTLGVLVVVGLTGFVASPLLSLLAPFVVTFVLAIAFLPVYYVLPDADVTLTEALPGAVFAAVGWTVIGTGFGMYASYSRTSGAFALYGVLGAILLLVTWFYLAGLLLLVGGVLNVVLAGRAGPGPAGTTRGSSTTRDD